MPLSIVLALSFGLFLAGCTPRVEVVAPEKPITINLNVKIDHEIRVKVEKELDEVLSEKSELF
ncbi:MAG: YnbE family lipoprotein [Nitrospirales bacterium]